MHFRFAACLKVKQLSWLDVTGPSFLVERLTRRRRRRSTELNHDFAPTLLYVVGSVLVRGCHRGLVDLVLSLVLLLFQDELAQSCLVRLLVADVAERRRRLRVLTMDRRRQLRLELHGERRFFCCPHALWEMPRWICGLEVLFISHRVIDWRSQLR